jgi:hypothetical protein
MDMADNGTSAGGVTLEELAQRMDEVQAESEAVKAETDSVRAENRRLNERVAHLEGGGGGSSRSTSAVCSSSALEPAESIVDQPVSRRGALRALGGVAAGGVGLALGSTLLGAEPASANDGDNLILGQLNLSQTRTTLSGIITSSSLLNLVNDDSSINSATLYAVKGASSGIEGIAAIIGDISIASVPAVLGLNNRGTGVRGQSGSPSGVGAEGGIATEVAGVSGDGGDGGQGVGVLGTGVFTGVQGLSNLIGVKAQSNATKPGSLGAEPAGLLAIGNEFAPALRAVGSGAGALLSLLPNGAEPPATSSPGDVVVLDDGSLWYSAVADKWLQLNKGFTHLLPTPIRVFDSRVTGAANAADPSRSAGPLAAQAIVTLQITGATVGGHSVPAGASAVIGNVTAVSPSADGWLTPFPHGEATPLVSNLNFQVGDKARGNFCVVALDATGKMDVFAQSQTQVVFDITGYVF